MVLIPAGEFQMGSNNGESDEKPVHSVYLDAFYIDIYEVTNALYTACVQAGGCTPPHESSSYTHSDYYGNSQYDDYPVIQVDWNQAKAYCEWRGSELPTEAQWEKAARGGLGGKDYPWGDEIPDCNRANFGGISGCVGDTSKVGSYPANGYGLFDMAGNVQEWVVDAYSEVYYAASPSLNPLGLLWGQYRVLRGASWGYDVRFARSARRGWNSPENWNNGLGLRCARLP